MKKIKDYCTISARDLNDKVVSHISAGWQPYGEMKVAPTNLYYHLFQTMVKYETPPRHPSQAVAQHES